LIVEVKEMNYEHEISNLKDVCESLKHRIESLEKKYDNSRIFTAKFLKACEDVGIKNVCIMDKNEIVKSSVGFAFGVSGSVFADEEFQGWPAIWKACEISGISSGCGNPGQHQISYKGQNTLIDGTYSLKNGKWQRINEN
jgi:hypothetical protein